MEDKDFYILQAEVRQLEKEISHSLPALREFGKFEVIQKNIIDKLEDIKSDKIESIKNEIYEIKNVLKELNQAKTDIKRLQTLAEVNKDVYITRKEMDEKRYKDWRIWIAAIALLFSIIGSSLGIVSYIDNQETQEKMEAKNSVLSDSQK